MTDPGYLSFDQRTAVLDTTGEGYEERAPRRRRLVSNGGSDLGLLIIRAVLGATYLTHGLQVVFGLYGGNGVSGLADGLARYGYGQSATLALVVGWTELIVGGLVIIGLLTPLAAAALLAMAINAILVKYSGRYFVQPDNPPGFEFDVLLAGMAAGLVFAGPGRISLDVAFPWFRRPLVTGWICLVLGVAAAVLVYFLLRR